MRCADAWCRRVLPIDAFFEWKAVLGPKVKQPFAIAMADRSPFGLGEPAGPSEWQVGAHVCGDYDQSEQSCGRDPRPNAGHSAARGLRPMTLRPARPSRPAQAGLVRSDDYLARVYSGDTPTNDDPELLVPYVDASANARTTATALDR